MIVFFLPPWSFSLSSAAVSFVNLICLRVCFSIISLLIFAVYLCYLLYHPQRLFCYLVYLPKRVFSQLHPNAGSQHYSQRYSQDGSHGAPDRSP
jgi:hypothetical protein